MSGEHGTAGHVHGGENGTGDGSSVGPASPFQVMPPMSPDEFAALVDDIRANGVRIPIDVDVHGRIVDGHHRAAACQVLGIEVPRRVVEITTDEAARAHAFTVNTARRHLTRDQKRDLIARSLILDPALSDRGHAQRCGASPSTVATVRAALIDAGQLSNLDTRVGRDGRKRTTGPKWTYPTTELLTQAMHPHGLDRVQPLTARLPLPGMSSWQWDEFVDSIADEGIWTPILVTRDGMLVDGRLRLIASHLTGADVPIKVLSDSDDPQAVTLGHNVYRHNMTETQARARHGAVRLMGQVIAAGDATDQDRQDLTELLIAGGMTDASARDTIADLDASLAVGAA